MSVKLRLWCLAAALLLSPGDRVWAQSDPIWYTLDFNGGANNSSLDATATTNVSAYYSPSGNYAEAETWIDYLSTNVQCKTGTGGTPYMQSGACKLLSTSTNIYPGIRGVYAWVTFSHTGTHWNTWTAHSKHYTIKDGAWTWRTELILSRNFGYPPQTCNSGNQYGSGCYSSPIVIPTGAAAAVQFSSPADGVMFDLDGDGTLDRVAWPEGDAAWLAIDLDGDGAITSGRELIGQNTAGRLWTTGFDALGGLGAALGDGYTLGNLDGSVNAEDPLFSRLLLWQDASRDGICQPGELRPASELLTGIGLGYSDSGKKDQYGTRYRYQGGATFVNGRTLPVYDVFPAIAAQ